MVLLSGYGVGLILTFVALTSMGIAQPALIYLVPATLISVSVVALARKDLQKMWHGSTGHKESAVGI